jgi:hypothetical protein
MEQLIVSHLVKETSPCHIIACVRITFLSSYNTIDKLKLAMNIRNLHSNVFLFVQTVIHLES